MTPSTTTSMLFQRYVDQTATDEEKAQLLESLSAANEDGTLDQLLQSLWKGLEVKEAVFNDEKKLEMLEHILQRKRAVVRPMISRWIASIAAILILIVTGYFLFNNKKEPPLETANTNRLHDIEAPKQSKAVIILADGRQILIDSISNGILAQQHSVKVIKNENGEIVYQANAESNVPPAYNIILNPRGSKVISLVLIDGTKVWLNSESSLKYPTTFYGNTREVEISGEAYFEVAHDPSKPFAVSKGETKVQVLGTHFNINAFDDEEESRVTLLEGEVKVSVSGKSVTIKPQEQAVVKPHIVTIDDSPDVSEVMAWKNGIFRFKDVTIEPLMRQIARWYDVKVVYEGKPTNHFVATIPRDVSAANVFQILEQTGGVHFTIKGNQVFVKP